jgi:hypothetical protein
MKMCICIGERRGDGLPNGKDTKNNGIMANVINESHQCMK